MPALSPTSSWRLSTTRRARPGRRAADGTGSSLQRLGSGAFADDPANWQAALPTAGFLNQGALTVDSDDDGLPDEWELANGLDPAAASGVNGPLDDPDNDGLNNLQECLAGTDPHNSQETLRFGHVSCSNSVCRLQFNAHTRPHVRR